MKIEAKILKTFIEKVSVNGTLPSIVLRFSKEGIDVKTRSVDNIAIVTGHLENDVLKNPEDMVLPIKDTKLLLTMIKDFEGEIEIKKVDNIVKFFNEKRQIDVVLASEDFIETELKELPSFATKFDGGILIETAVMKKASNNMTSLKTSKVCIEVKDKVMTFGVGDKNFDSIQEKIKVDYADCKNHYGETFCQFVNVIDKNVTFTMKNDFPFQLSEKNEGMLIKYILAPIIDDGKKEE